MAIGYFLKSVGLSGTAFQPNWWQAKPELRDAVFSGRQPRAIHVADCLIYYAVETGGMVCAVAEVTGPPTDHFPIPHGMTAAWRAKFHWKIPVRVLCRCDADNLCPRLKAFTPTRMGPGSYKSIDPALAHQMIGAICARRAGQPSGLPPT